MLLSFKKFQSKKISVVFSKFELDFVYQGTGASLGSHVRGWRGRKGVWERPRRRQRDSGRELLRALPVGESRPIIQPCHGQPTRMIFSSLLFFIGNKKVN